MRDDSTSKKKTSMAEDSRPARETKRIEHAKRKKPQGRKLVHEAEDAKYMNWHQPFLWSQIVDAANHPSVGYKMSATRICHLLGVRNPTSFSKIAASTADGWIDCSSGTARWSDAALAMAEHGNRPGGNGGNFGVLVSGRYLREENATYIA